MTKDLCMICLRTDKTLKSTDSILVEYHDELSDFNTDTPNPLFCGQCEQQLRKHYNFRNKVQRAARILQAWENSDTIHSKTPIDILYKQLASSSLSVCSQDTADEICYNYEETKGELCALENIISDETEIKQEIKLSDLNQQTNNTDIKETIKTRRFSEKKHLVNKTTEPLQFEQGEADIKLDDQTNLQYLIDYDDPNDLDYEVKSDIGSLESLENESEVIIPPQSLKKSSTAKKRTLAVKDKKSNTSSPKKKAKLAKEVSREKTNKTISCKSKTNKQSKVDDENISPEAERLKKELATRFEACGELKSSDGVVIDKEYILECVHRKMKEPTMELLWAKLRASKSTIGPKVIKTLAFLQNRFRRLDKYEDVFDIEYFNTMEKVKEEFQNRKNYPAFLAADHKCHVCYQKFNSEKCMERHQRWHKESSGAHVCEICQYRFPSEERVKHHFACFHQAVFKCKLCTYVTYNSENMDGHYNRHRNLKATCEICHKIFANKSILRFHIRTRHSAQGPQVKICALCGKSFCEQWFRRHLLKHHGVAGGTNPPIENGVPCAECRVTFPSTEVHAAHVRHVHPERAPEPALARRGKRRTEAKDSRAADRDNEAFGERRPNYRGEWTCRICSAVGKTWGKLMIHFEFEHPDHELSTVYADTTATLCEICGKGLANVYSLRDHMRIHTGDRPYACDMCPKRFSRIIGLKGHRLTHFPKSKPCPHCGKMFRQTGNLLNHVRIHLNDRKYKCKACGKGFLHRQAVKEHFNGVHLHVRRVKRGKGRDTAHDAAHEQNIYTESSEYE